MEIRMRWEELPLKRFRDELLRDMAKHNDLFLKRNRKQIKLIGETPWREWYTFYEKMDLRGYYEVEQRINKWAGTISVDGAAYFDLRGFPFPVNGIRGVRFENTDLSFSNVGTNFQGEYINCIFEGTDLSNEFMGLYYENCTFKSVKFPEGSTVGFFVFKNCQFVDCKMSAITNINLMFDGCRITNCDFRKTYFLACIYKDSIFTGCKFRGCYLKDIYFYNNKYIKCDFAGATGGFIPPEVVGA